MSKFPIPDSALTAHTAILGKTGSGKTTTAKVIIEHVVEEGARVCILDPIKSDWWGLTSSASGKRAGLPFQILGGPHGHVPLHSSAGKAIGELVARGSLPLSIIDMADFEPGGLQAFFVDFAQILMKRIKGVVYLVVEEAHEFAPKERAGIGKENLAIHFAKKLAIAGRTKGIRMIVATQRTQALHNAVLGSCETMVVHRFTAPADQEPVLKWLKGNVKDKAQRELIESGISGLENGQAWVVSGVAKILECVQFPRAATYDNTKTPDVGDEESQVHTAAVDVDKLRSIIGDAVVEAERDDPKKLREEIASRDRDLAARDKQISHMRAQLAEAGKVDADRSYKDGYDTGQQHGYGAGWNKALVHAEKQFSELRGAALRVLTQALTAVSQVVEDAPSRDLPKWQEPQKEAVPEQLARAARLPTKVLFPEPKPGRDFEVAKAHVNRIAGGDGAERPSVRKILDAFHKAFPVSLSFEAAARRAGISRRSSSWGKYKAAIAESAELEQDGDRYRSRPEFSQSGGVDAGASIDTWVGRLPPTYGAMLRAIYQHGPIDRTEVANRANVSPSSSGLSSGLGELLRLQLVAKDKAGKYRMAEGLE